ncbi:MAG: DinB family protein [Acidobacteriota bacterium]|nr:DinB family protein [Acidobacteriota bacterium]
MTELKSVEEIYEALDKARSKVVETVSGLTDEQANFQPSTERWSARLIVEHLAKIEANLVRVVGKLLGKAEAENVTSDGSINPPVSFAAMAERARNERFQAPAFIAPEGAASIAESLNQLSQSRVALLEMRPRIEAVDCSTVQYPHPIFGRFNLYQWLGFIGVHELHHLAQIKNLLANQKQ